MQQKEKKYAVCFINAEDGNKQWLVSDAPPVNFGLVRRDDPSYKVATSWILPAIGPGKLGGNMDEEIKLQELLPSAHHATT